MRYGPVTLKQVESGSFQEEELNQNVFYKQKGLPFHSYHQTHLNTDESLTPNIVNIRLKLGNYVKKCKPVY